MSVWILAGLIFSIAAVMTMTGRGGGNFYVLAIALAGFSMHEAAAIGQFVLIVSSLAATVLFSKQNVTDWKLVALIGSMTLVSAFFGGFCSDLFPDRLLKIVFAFFVFVASLLMLKPVKNEMKPQGRLTCRMTSGDAVYPVHVLLVVPVVLTTGFIAGMVGVSGGSFLVPLMTLALRVPMRVAVGTSTTLVLITASAGFLGHISSGHFNVAPALPLAIGGLLGGGLGARLTLKFKPKNLKYIFAITSLTAAMIMVIKVVVNG
ncbi:MAG: sulfite exporter TauE/SafE family protein [Spartobacteria bacterium]|nr:sulfite exporter TauE/SafE family protein [Spartobacteria bacterium]